MQSETIKPLPDATPATDEVAVQNQEAPPDFIAQTQQLVSGATEQLRAGIELLFAELDLSVAAIKWALVAAVMFVVTALIGFTFLVTAILAYAVGESASLTSVLMTCGLINSLLALIMFYLLHSLCKKIRFQELRQLLGKEDNDAST